MIALLAPAGRRTTRLCCGYYGFAPVIPESRNHSDYALYSLWMTALPPVVLDPEDEHPPRTCAPIVRPYNSWLHRRKWLLVRANGRRPLFA